MKLFQGKKMRLFTKGPRGPETLFLELASRIVRQMPQSPGLPARLGALAQAVAELPELAGAMVVASDGEGIPICYRGCGLSLSSAELPFEELAELQAQCLAAAAEGNEWTEVGSAPIQPPGAFSVVGRLLNGEDGESVLGMILVSLPEDAEPAGPSLTAIMRAMEHLRWAVSDALRMERMQCLADLQNLATEELAKAQLAIEPRKIAKRLQSIFHAETVTILVQEQGKIYLSATTDAKLEKRARTYDTRRGLTGLIFKDGRTLRLRNVNDPAEVAVSGGIKPQNVRQLETLANSGAPFRLLAVPMGADGKTRGVIRILRKAEDAPFSAVEETALHEFADLFGAVVDASWQLFLDSHIREARSEAFCISRNERRKGGESVPRFVYVNPGAEDLFGLKSDEIVGLDVRDLYAEKREYEKVRDLLAKSIRQKERVCGPVKVTVKGPGGEIRSVNISYRLLTSPHVQPATHYAISVIRDITEAQVRDEGYRCLEELLDTKGLAYFRADEEGYTIESSSAESRMTGYSPEELRGKRREVLYADPRERKKFLARVHQGDGQLVHTTQRFRRKDGTYFFAQGVMQFLKDDDGYLKYQGLYEDVTERIRLQEFLDADPGRVLREHELLEKLQENASFYLDFVSSLSHQLRGPLGAMVHNLLNLQDGIVEKESRFGRRLEFAIGQATVCSILLRNLAFMDKILRGESFRFQPANLTKLAIETTVDFRHLLPEKKLTIKLDDASLDELRKEAEIWGHPDLLRQILVNLVDNAIKYSRKGTEIRIRGFSAGPQGRVLEITNRGIRIAQEDRDRVFSRGFRSEKAKMWVPGGTGLGLWLVRKIVRAHGASIRCTEVGDAGEARTAFQIFFPHQALKRSMNTGGPHGEVQFQSPHR